MTALPARWKSLSFDEAVEPISDGGKRVDQSDYLREGKLPVIDQGEEFIGGYTNDESKAYTGPLPVVIFGDHTRRVKFVDFPFVIGAQGVKLLRPREGWFPRFFAYLLPTRELPDRGYSRHYQFVRKLQFPQPPEPEQRRIVAEIEKQFTRLEAGVAALRRVQANLHRYRAAVLKAACESRLVATDTGKWKQATIKELGEVKGGKRLPAGHTYSEEPTSFPYIRVVDFSNGTVALENLKYLKAETQAAISRYTISKRDVYISIAGTIGLVGVIPEMLDGANLTENAAKICNLTGVLPKYLCCYLASLSGQSQIAGYTLATTQSKLALFRIEKIVVPLPPVAEQERIVAEVERRLSVVEELSALVTANLQRATRLRQATLQQAFEGKLVKAAT